MTALRRLPWRAFLTAFILSMCVLGLICACLLIEYNIQQTSYGRVDFGLTYTIEKGAPLVTRTDTQETISLLSADNQHLAAVAVPAPMRLLTALVQGEIQASQWFWEWIDQQ